MSELRTNSDREAGEQILRELNDRYQNGDLLLVNGREIYSQTNRAPVMIWGNGTLSFEVRQRKLRQRSTMIFVKAGSSFALTEGEA